MPYSKALINISSESDRAIRMAFEEAARQHPTLVATLPNQYELRPYAQELDSDFRHRTEDVAEALISVVVKQGLLWQNTGDIRQLRPMPAVQVSFIPGIPS
jgi:hypothetical protein